MAIINVDQCLNQLSDSVQKQIVQKQNEKADLVCHENLHSRLHEHLFRKKLLTHVTAVEKKFLDLFMQRYSSYSLEPTERVEQYYSSIEEKLALLLFLQKGIVYKVRKDKHEQEQFIIPIEIIDTYFELQWKQNNEKIMKNPKTINVFMYYLLEVLSLIREQKIKNKDDTNIVNELFSAQIHWDVIIKFLLDEQLIDEREFKVKEQHCQVFFGKTVEEIREKLTLFIVKERLQNEFACHFFQWAFYKSKKAILHEQFIQYLLTVKNVTEEKISEVIEQLLLLEILVKEKQFLFVAKQEHEKENQGIEIGVLECLVPLTVVPNVLWTFRSWGKIEQWDFLVHFRFTPETMKQGIKSQASINLLKDYIKQYFSETTFTNWEKVITKWLKQEMPIIKKNQLTFYSVSEEIHLLSIKEHWPHWWEKTTTGIIIEKKFEQLFEQLLESLSLFLMAPKNEYSHLKQEKNVIICDEFPDPKSFFPEIERLPKQWFVLTGYEENVYIRITKQAIVLKLQLQLEVANRKLITLFPFKLHNNNGIYEIHGENKKRILLSAVNKMKLVHPLKETIEIKGD